jgi:hypothetical protein
MFVNDDAVVEPVPAVSAFEKRYGGDEECVKRGLDVRCSKRSVEKRYGGDEECMKEDSKPVAARDPSRILISVSLRTKLSRRGMVEMRSALREDWTLVAASSRDSGGTYKGALRLL